MTEKAKAGEPVLFGWWHQGETENESDFFLAESGAGEDCSRCIALYTASSDTDALRHQIRELKRTIQENDKYWKGTIKQNEALRQRVKELGTQVEDLIAMKLMLMASGEEYRAQLATQAEQISNLQMSLADAEALEIGTSERCKKQAEQIKVAQSAIDLSLKHGQFPQGSGIIKELQNAKAKLGEQ